MAAMQFWGVEVKAKEPNKVTFDEGHVIHLSQATLGGLKKDNEPVMIHVKVGEKKFVLGVLSQKTPQLSFDLVFDEEFEISHNWKNGSVHLLGYSTEMPEEHDDMFGHDSEDEDDDDIPTLRNGLPAAPAQVEAAKPDPAKDNKSKPQEKDDSDDNDSDEDEDDSDKDDDSDEDSMSKSDDDSDDDEDDDDDDDEPEDKKSPKPESGKKRANAAAAKTPEPKKAKLVTPQKTDGKKVVHTATPHPAKKGAKTPGSDKSTPKSGGQFGCEPCKKSFNSENALQSHNKAKHAAK